jgi:hypothetical protein
VKGIPIFGEIALSGSVRAVAHAGLRLKEAAKLGFTSAFAPLSPIASVASLVGLIAAATIGAKAETHGPRPGAVRPGNVSVSSTDFDPYVALQDRRYERARSPRKRA